MGLRVPGQKQCRSCASSDHSRGLGTSTSLLLALPQTCFTASSHSLHLCWSLLNLCNLGHPHQSLQSFFSFPGKGCWKCKDL